MPIRLSTAEILAAARAADGKQSASKPAQAAEPRTESTESAQKSPAVPSPAQSAPPEMAGERISPPAIGPILQQVRQVRGSDGPAVPTPLRSLLDAVRSNGKTDVCPPSIAVILQRVRDVCGTSGERTSGSTASVTNPGKSRSTAEILAAARQNKKPATITGESTAAVKPVAKAASTADILAAARRQGAIKADGGAAARSKSEPRSSAAPVQPSQRSEPAAVISDDGRPRPPAMAELLASVRSSTLEHQAAIAYPPLAEMLNDLRRLDRRGIGRASSQRAADGLLAKVKRWFSGSRDIHQGASI